MGLIEEKPVVSIERLRKEYPAPDAPLVVLDGVDLEVWGGEAVVVMGPSGSGKSTLLHIVGTLDVPSSGRVRLMLSDPAEMDEGALADFRRDEIGFVFQDHCLLPQCTALENVLAATLTRSRAERREAVGRAGELLRLVGLEARATHFPAALSGGEKQRVAIARAMINEPDVLLCDEPTGSLDRKTGDAVGEVFERLLEESGVAMLVATHDAGFAERFGRICDLNEGKLHERANA